MFRPGYTSDYYKASENSNEISSSTRMSSEPIQEDLIPLRWIPWEVYIMVGTKISYIYILISYDVLSEYYLHCTLKNLFQRLWSTKSDIWAFGITMWELFSLCREGAPLSDLTDQQIIENLQHWFHSDGFHLTPSKPLASGACTKEIFDLIKQCWSREPEDRPRFSEIYQFFQNRI